MRVRERSFIETHVRSFIDGRYRVDCVTMDEPKKILQSRLHITRTEIRIPYWTHFPNLARLRKSQVEQSVETDMTKGVSADSCEVVFTSHSFS